MSYINLPPQRNVKEYAIGDFIVKQKNDGTGSYWSHKDEGGWGGSFPEKPAPDIPLWYSMMIKAARKSEMQMAAAAAGTTAPTAEPAAKRQCVTSTSPASEQTMRLDLATIEAMVRKLQEQQDLIAHQLDFVVKQLTPSEDP